MPQRQFLRNHASHRDAEHVGALDARGVEHGGGIVCEIAHPEPQPGPARAPGAAVVEEDDAEVAREDPRKPAPAARREGKAHDEEERRRSLAAHLLVVDGVPPA